MKSAEGSELRVESSRPSFGLRSSSALAPTLNPQLSTLNPPRGVTLIELLITMMIISILAAAVLGVAAVAGETAREAKTRTIISRIHTLLMQQYDTYTSRRVKVDSAILNGITNLNANAAAKGRLKAEARLYALRELMLMEIPDRWSDVLLREVPSPPNTSTSVAVLPIYFDAPLLSDASPYPITRRTEVAGVYLRNFRRIAGATNKITGQSNTTEEILANQGAECLFMVVMNACGDGESRTLFPESSIADTDGDGAPEFVDGWGHPIEFLRWAPGFESDIQSDANKLDAAADRDTAWMTAGSADHDPFDLYRTQPTAFRLVPLVYSAGRDEEFGLVTNGGSNPWRPTSYVLELSTSGSPPYVKPALNPYVTYAGYGYLGTADASTKASTDNLTNHLIGTR
ncbi:MAG: type II secretion system protein [Pirellulales bacterium]